MRFEIKKPKDVYVLPQFGGCVLEHEYAATNRYLTRDGKPFIYRMGEMHFSRVPAKDWETELIKMRDGGIQIVSSYLFWIHHEETEGEFDFSGDRDLHRFCLTCKKVGMPLFLRPGPWAHGEARNGGHPDWVLEKCGGKEHTRCNEEPYLGYVRRFFRHVYEEIKDCMDVIVGIQVENELHKNAEHLETLYDDLREMGYRAPIWTATGWGHGTGASIPKDKMIPVYGGYPEAPWAAHTDPIKGQDSYFFSDNWDSAQIGTDVMETDGTSQDDSAKATERYPYLTCEVGGGNQVTYHRRPLISTLDIASVVTTRLGSGANGIGYYMYHGGKNPIGKTTMQESRQSGYKNDYPIVSYDFQSPIGECGQLRESYYALQSIHAFLEHFGEKLAQMPAIMPLERPKDTYDLSTLRCAVRSDGESGFLFFNNHTHVEEMQSIEETVHISLPNASEIEIPLSVCPHAYGIIPFGFTIGTERVKWVSAMPVFVSDEEIIFEKIAGIDAKITFANGKIMPLDSVKECGGLRVTLWDREVPKKKPIRALQVKAVEKTIPDTVFAHIENRDGTPLEHREAVDYQIEVPEGAQYLSIKAVGNAAAIFYDGKLLSDFYLYGDDWYVDVRDLPKPASLILKVLPMTAENLKKIYLEIGMPLEITLAQAFSTTV